MATQMVSQASGSGLFCNSGSFGISDMYGLPDLSKAEITAPRLIMLANVALTGELSNGCCDYALEEDRQMAELTTVYENSFSDSEGDRMETDSEMGSEEAIFETMEAEHHQVETEEISNSQSATHDDGKEAEPQKYVETQPVAEEKNKNIKSKPFQCRPCQYKAESEEEFVHHIKDHSAKRYINNDANKTSRDSGSCSTEESDVSKGPIRCDRCGYNTNRIDHYLAHLKHHNKSAENERVYKCTICTYTTVSEYHWKKHLRNHFPRIVYTCSQCSYFSDRKNNYIQHIRTHTGERPYRCIMCPYSSSQKTHLTRHMRTHSGEKPFKCEQCCYVASNQHEVTRHARQVHNGPKPLTCPHCNYKTADRSNFKKHVELHVNPRQFLCPVCDYAASKKCNLQYHIKSRHSDCSDITMDVSKVKLRTKKEASVSEPPADKQEEKENLDIRSDLSEIMDDDLKLSEENCVMLKPALTGQVTTRSCKISSSKTRTSTDGRKNTLKTKSTKRNLSAMPVKGLKTTNTHDGSMKKKKSTQNINPGLDGNKAEKSKKKKDCINRNNKKKLFKNKANEKTVLGCLEIAEIKTKQISEDNGENRMLQNTAFEILLVEKPVADTLDNHSVLQPMGNSEEALNKTVAFDKDHHSSTIETEQISELPLKRDSGLNGTETATPSNSTISHNTKNQDIDPQALPEMQTSQQHFQAGDTAVVSEATENSHEFQFNQMCETNSENLSLETIEENALKNIPENSDKSQCGHVGDMQNISEIGIKTNECTDNKANGQDLLDATISADVLHPESSEHTSCAQPRSSSLEVEEDEGIHSHDGSDISDNVSERSDDSGLNGLKSAQESLGLKPTSEFPSLETFVCIFCDRIFKKAEEYTKHLKRHLVNVYYLEKASQDLP